MENGPSGLMNEVLSKRTSLASLVISAVMLGFGINLLASSVFAELGQEAGIGIGIGVLLTIAPLAWLVIILFSKKMKKRTYRGFFLYDVETNKTVPVEHYDFSQSLIRYLESIFVENNSIAELWNGQRLGIQNLARFEDNEFKMPVNASKQLISEALEYFVLERLSTTLSDYFNKIVFNKEEIQKLSRDDVPSLIDTNRFLAHFSRPIHERPHFIRGRRDETRFDRSITVFGPDGVRFQQFDIVLPRGCKVERVEENKVQIDTKFMTIEILAAFGGFNTHLPDDFVKYYVAKSKQDRSKEYDQYEVKVVVSVNFKASIIFSRLRAEYYEWIDEFLEELDIKLSQDRFLRDIGWAIARTMMEVDSTSNECKGEN